jgi:hypothetical protein
VLVSVAAAIALDATSMSDIAVLAHLAPVLGVAPSGPTVRRALDLAGTSLPAMTAAEDIALGYKQLLEVETGKPQCCHSRG